MKKLFIMLVVIALLAGCASGNKNESEGTTGSKETASAGSNEETKNSASVSGDNKISIVLSHSEAAYAKQADAKNDMYIKKLEELSGYDLDIEILGHADYGQQLSLRFASGELPDLIRTASIEAGEHKGAVDNGAFTEIGPLLDQYGPNLKNDIPEEIWKDKRVSKDGKIYGIPVLMGAGNTRIAFIRQDWLNKLNMKSPETLDDWLNYYEAVKKEDMNGNGDPNDEYGIEMFENMWFSEIFFQSFGVHPSVWHEVDGQLIPDMIRPEMKEAVQFYRTLFEKGYVNPDFVTKKESDFRADIYNGKVGSWAGETYQYNPSYSKTNGPKWFVNQPDQVDVSFIAPPKGPRGQTGYGMKGDGIYFVWVIPSSVKNPEKIIKFLDWTWASEEADRFFKFGIEGHNYTLENGEVKYDVGSKENSDNDTFQMYQLTLNTREIGLNNPDVVKQLPEGDKIVAGYELSDSLVMDHVIGIPTLKTFEEKPELYPFGSLFIEMFLKVMTGEKGIDEFDKFVANWKKRGGDQAIEDATKWYNESRNK
ncbi:extracellular solute-binding protein [Cohnella herbarum]|uniref:Extracellular solute-binding protein n=1 Tax=Cohnella herbarum TaxID=2728023 RepID=A0A7Z2VGM8_9BACL|nr:extracellular solute-binding protein [Cohnella herbarum]QJD82545.1 extracellular solute-binding protein [Cohnella herbarum]